MIKKSLVFGFALAGLTTLNAQDNLIKNVKGNGSANAHEDFVFTTVVNNETTSVKNQGSSGTCWSYGGNSFIETEIIRNGGSAIDLAEMYTVRKVYEEKADLYVRLNGYFNFGQGGALNDAIDMLGKYGAVPQEAYTGLIDGQKYNRHGELEAVLKGIVSGVKANPNGKLTSVWKSAFNSTLSAYLGEDPKEFTYKGVKYTPKSFADKFVKLNAEDYVSITSFSHHPYFSTFPIRVPDNWSWKESFNVPLEDFTPIVDNALKEGYTIHWAADVSSKGFSLKNGLMIVSEKKFGDMNEQERSTRFNGPKKEREITTEARQFAYDTFDTTDDHAMHIVGLAKDQNGKEYYIVKNSWGKNRGAFEGYLYASKAYFKLRTMSIHLNKNGVKKSYRKKLKM